MPVLSKVFLDIQATMECGFTLKCVCDMIRTCSQYKIMLRIIEKMFIVLLSNIINGSNHTKYVLLSSQKCMTTLINLHPNEYSQELHCYPFAVKLDKCVGSCNTLNDISNKVCAPNKTEDINLSVFNMITGISESKTLTH